MSFDDEGGDFEEFGSTFELPVVGADADGGPLGPLPKLSRRHARFAAGLARLDSAGLFDRAAGWLAKAAGGAIEVGAPEVAWRASGLRRVGLVAQAHWPRYATRVALGVETPLAHAVVDRLLGFDRLPAETRLPLSPVEWGVWTYVATEALHRLSKGPRDPLGPWDLTVDRVGPDPFDVDGLGRVVTVRWPVRLGNDSGSLRLWLAEAVVARWLLAEPPATSRPLGPGTAEWSSSWRAEAGTVALPRGLSTVRAGGVLPVTGSTLRGSAASPVGSVRLSSSVAQPPGRYVIPAEAEPGSAGARLTVTGTPAFEPTPREAVPVSTPSTPNPNPNPTAPPAGPPADVPVTLVVELGRVNVSLARLADLRPGDVLELGRHAKEPIELTSGGRLVARGELVQIDTELGVRVTNVFF